MANGLKELNDIMFEELNYLKDRSLAGEELKAEIERARTIASMAEKIIAAGNTVLRAQEMVGEYNSSKDVDVPNYLTGICQ